MVSVEIKYSTFKSVSHQCILPGPVNTSRTIYTAACELFDDLWDETPIRLLGIRTSKLTDVLEPSQMTLFDFMPDENNTSPSAQTKQQSKKQLDLELALDKIRDKYGKDAVVRGTQIKK